METRLRLRLNFHVLRSFFNSDFVTTSRPELLSNLFCGTKFTRRTHKIKHNDVIEEDTVDSNDMGCKNLIANLSKCHEAVSFKTHVLKLIFENSLMTA